MSMQFFVVLGTREIRHLRVNRNVQDELAGKFREESAEYLNDTEAVEFDPGFNPDEGELFRLPEYELPEELVRGGLRPHHFPHVEVNMVQPGNVRAIVGVDVADGEIQLAVFKAVSRAQVLGRDGWNLVFFEGNTMNRLTNGGLTIPDRVDAVFRNGTLYFHSLRNASRFLDLAERFREASDEVVSEFLEAAPVSYEDEEGVFDLLDSWCRRRISMLAQRPIWRDIGVRQIRERARDFGVDVKIRRRRGTELLVLPETRAELKQLLRLLNDDFLLSTLTNTRYLTNSKRTVTAD